MDMATWYKKIKESIGVQLKLPKKLTNYTLAKMLNKNGVDITHVGLNGFETEREDKALKTLVHCRKLSGESWITVGKWLDNDYLK